MTQYTEKRFTVPLNPMAKQWPTCGSEGPSGVYCRLDWGHKGECEGVTDNDEIVRWTR